MSFTERTELLINSQNIKKLAESNVIVFGCGGVGGYVIEMLARTGVGSLTIVDFDVISTSNINRQIIALNSTVGREKVAVIKERIADINPNCKVDALAKKVEEKNIDEFYLNRYDFVIDCIDMVKSKVAIMDYCFRNRIRTVSAMGAGNRNGIPEFKVKDIFETSHDGLAKVLRKELKNRGVTGATVVCSEQQAQKHIPVGSIVYYPAMCGCVISAHVINTLMDNV